MINLVLDVRLDGFDQPIGKLRRATDGGLSFVYADSYMANTQAMPLSLFLPLRAEPYADVASRAFFSNLLQERDAPLRQVMEQHGIASHDIAGLLHYLGAECAGALSVLPEGAPAVKVPGNPETDYQILSQQQLEDLVLALHRREALPDRRRDASPLSGVQSKLSVCCRENATIFALPTPNSGAPTTHVLKVPDAQHLVDAKRERHGLVLSALCGIDTVLAETNEISGIPVLITTRFDRAMDEKGFINRIHQEDFAQALGLPPELKYQRRGTDERRFDSSAIASLLTKTEQPSTSVLQFLKFTLFDLLIGNVDAHAKNHALLYLGSRTPRLAPRYDLLPTRMEQNITEQLSYDVGGAQYIEKVDGEAMAQFMSSLGIVSAHGQKRILSEILSKLVPVLDENLAELQDLGQKSFADLIATNMRLLLPKLDYPVPSEAQNRDVFALRGGGWQTS